MVLHGVVTLADENVPGRHTAEAVHEPGPHGGTVIGRGRAGSTAWTFEVALHGQKERTWLVQRGDGGVSSSGGRRDDVPGPPVEISGTGSSPER